MEIILYILILVLLSLNLAFSIAMSNKISDIEILSEFFQRKWIQSLDVQGEDIDNLQREFKKLSEHIKSEQDRPLQAILERLDAAKPIKPNNWDSVKEAFKGRARIEINERN